MSKYQQEWKKVLKQGKLLKGAKIRTSGGDVIVRVPEDTDMIELEERFPKIIAELAPNVISPKSTLKFYVGDNEQADFIYTLN